MHCKIRHDLLTAPDGQTSKPQSQGCEHNVPDIPAPAQARNWARPGAGTIAALVDLRAAEVRKPLAKPDEG